MYRIVICDDEIFFCNHIEKLLRKYTESLADDMDIQIYTSSDAFLDDIGKSADLYFLDIKMPGNSGLELANVIRSISPDSVSIFVSSLQDAVYESIQYSPFRFIRKEYLETELKSTACMCWVFLSKICLLPDLDYNRIWNSLSSTNSHNIQRHPKCPDVCPLYASGLWGFPNLLSGESCPETSCNCDLQYLFHTIRKYSVCCHFQHCRNSHIRADVRQQQCKSLYHMHQLLY